MRKNRPKTALNSIIRATRLRKGFPARNPKTGEVATYKTSAMKKPVGKRNAKGAIMRAQDARTIQNRLAVERKAGLRRGKK